MKQIELTKNIPTTITMIAQAVWNEEKGMWEVDIQEMGTCLNAKDNAPLYYQESSHFEAEECNEYIIPVAILNHNGIDTSRIRFVDKDRIKE